MSMCIGSEETFGAPTVGLGQPPDRLERLRLALWNYEQVNGPTTTPVLILDSNGGLRLHTEDAGMIEAFANAEEALAWLVSATAFSQAVQKGWDNLDLET